MNVIVVSGNLTTDPVVKSSQSGTSVCTFRIANNHGYGDKKQTSFLHIVCFGKTAENCEKYLHKGSKAIIRGRIVTGEYTNKEGRKVYTTDIYADEVEFLPKGEGRQADRAEEPQEQIEIPNGFAALDADSVPF